MQAGPFTRVPRPLVLPVKVVRHAGQPASVFLQPVGVCHAALMLRPLVPDLPVPLQLIPSDPAVHDHMAMDPLPCVPSDRVNVLQFRQPALLPQSPDPVQEIPHVLLCPLIVRFPSGIGQRNVDVLLRPEIVLQQQDQSPLRPSRVQLCLPLRRDALPRRPGRLLHPPSENGEHFCLQPAARLRRSRPVRHGSHPGCRRLCFPEVPQQVRPFRGQHVKKSFVLPCHRAALLSVVSAALQPGRRLRPPPAPPASSSITQTSVGLPVSFSAFPLSADQFVRFINTHYKPDCAEPIPHFRKLSFRRRQTRRKIMTGVCLPLVPGAGVEPAAAAGTSICSPSQ